ncbi:uncharacterized protein LOC124897804 [Capsicum annuum]|uniref:uncharacterized protein LOC124897804 n=1 Tax=Capsicum annuum TaxID=4072 RepID=UPI001FB0ECF1|nr:uncharacterized protein LOC124897804 [Capsicum annuum]
MDLFVKHLLSGKTKKVKAVASQERADFYSEKKANYLNNQGVSKAVEKETKVGTTMINLDIRTVIKVDKLEKNNGKETEVVITTFPKPPPPFPNQLKKKGNNIKFSKFMATLKQLTINLPLVEALEQIPRYAKFIKDLIMKKWSVTFKLMDNLHHCGAISIRSLVLQKVDLGAFTIPCTIRPLDFAKALCDLGASINLMPLDVYKKLGLGDTTPTNM